MLSDVLIFKKTLGIEHYQQCMGSSVTEVFFFHDDRFVIVLMFYNVLHSVSRGQPAAA